MGKEQDKSILEYIKKYNLKNVIYLGEKNNVSDYYSMFDIFAFPSNKGEAAGLALYEALANGLECIISPNVPKLYLTTNNLSVADLDMDKWINKIESINNSYIRNNYIKKSEYDLSNEVSKYYELFMKIK